MEAPPPLPDSNDPYEILGLEYGCSERDLKRAYARLIRVYRPDRQPAQFRCVRAAFESVQEELGDVRPPWDESEDFEDAPDPQDHAESEVPPLQFADIIGDGDPDVARARLEQAREHDPGSARPYALRFLLEEALGASFEVAATHLHAGLEHGTPIAEWLEQVLSAREFEEFVLGDGCGWEILNRQEERDLAVMLFEERCHMRLLRGEEEDVVREVSTPEFRRAAERHEGLRQLGLRIACAVAWHQPDEAEELHAYYASGPEADDWIDDGYQDRVRLRESWLRWAADSAGADMLLRYIQLSHTVPDPDLRRLGAGERPWRGILASLDRMQRIDEQLGYFLVFALDTGDVARDDDEEPEVRTLTRRQKHALVQFRDVTEKLLDKSWSNRVLEFGILAAVVALVVIFRVWGLWAGLGAAVVCFVGLGWAVVSTDERMYRRFVRERILPLVAQHGIAPERVVSWLKKNTKGSENLNRLDDEITDDLSLQLVYRLKRFFG